MELGNLIIWNNIEGNPICSLNDGIKLCKGEIVNPNFTAWNIAPDAQDLFNNKSVIVIIPTYNKIDIETYCSSLLPISPNLIYKYIIYINQEICTLLNIINSPIAKDIETFERDEDVFKKLIVLYEGLYVPVNEKTSRQEIVSISFKLNYPNDFVTIKNFQLISYIIDCLRKHYEFDIPVSHSFKKELQVFKKEISLKLYNFFRIERSIQYCSNKRELYRRISKIFSLSEVDVKVDAIRKWIENN